MLFCLNSHIKYVIIKYSSTVYQISREMSTNIRQQQEVMVIEVIIIITNLYEK